VSLRKEKRHPVIMALEVVFYALTEYLLQKRHVMLIKYMYLQYNFEYYPPIKTERSFVIDLSKEEYLRTRGVVWARPKLF
jgi:hypothetical protein